MAKYDPLRDHLTRSKTIGWTSSRARSSSARRCRRWRGSTRHGGRTADRARVAADDEAAPPTQSAAVIDWSVQNRAYCTGHTSPTVLVLIVAVVRCTPLAIPG